MRVAGLAPVSVSSYNIIKASLCVCGSQKIRPRFLSWRSLFISLSGSRYLTFSFTLTHMHTPRMVMKDGNPPFPGLLLIYTHPLWQSTWNNTSTHTGTHTRKTEALYCCCAKITTKQKSHNRTVALDMTVGSLCKQKGVKTVSLFLLIKPLPHKLSTYCSCRFKLHIFDQYTTSATLLSWNISWAYMIHLTFVSLAP